MNCCHQSSLTLLQGVPPGLSPLYFTYIEYNNNKQLAFYYLFYDIPMLSCFSNESWLCVGIAREETLDYLTWLLLINCESKHYFVIIIYHSSLIELSASIFFKMTKVGHYNSTFGEVF